MIPWLSHLRAQVDAIDPQLWFAAVAVAVGTLVFVWRKLAPSTWDKLPSRFKVLPAAIVGSLLTAGAGANARHIIINLVIGAFAGLAAAGGHEMGVRLLSGAGNDRKKAIPKTAAKKPEKKAAKKADADDAPEPKKDSEEEADK